VLLATLLIAALVGSPDSAASVGHDSTRTSVATPARDYLAEMRASFTPENRSYWKARVTLAFVDPVVGLLIGALVLFTGLAARMRDLAAKLTRSRWLQLLVVLALFTLVTLVLSFPLTWYGDFVLEHHYGLSNQSFGAWLGDLLKETMVTLVFLGVVPIVALGYHAIRRSPRRWWLWMAVATLPLSVGAVLIQPLVVDPLFNRFEPLKDPHLKAEILQLAERAGIPGRNVYQVDKSKQTKTYNAYVNGFGVSQRIVLWDTMLQGMKEDEILFVMAHEMGHYKLAHIWKGILESTVGAFAFFWLVAMVARAGVKRFGHAWGFDDLADPASLPWLLTVISLVVFLQQPIVNGLSRQVESEADVFALEVTHDNDAGARTYLKLASQNRSNPEPPAWIRFTLYSHPTLAERVRLALTYHPWLEGRPNRFYEPTVRKP